MAPTSLSIAARALRDFLANGLGLQLTQVTIGHPGGAARENDEAGENGLDLLNLFFYRVERDGYPADGPSADPFYLRAYCLLTAFCQPQAGGNGASAGERDLQLIGGAIEQLHAQPLIRIRQDQREVAALQVVMHPLQLDDINHIWATQGDLPYRLSVSYEFALLPMPLSPAVERSPRVGGIGLGVATYGRLEAAGPAGSRVPARVVDLSDGDWAPVLRLVVNGELHHALLLPADNVGANIAVIGAGRVGEIVSLAWDRWDRVAGWRPLPGRTPLRLGATSVGARLEAPLQPTILPLPETAAGQLQLIAEREVPGPGGENRIIRSDPLLVTLAPQA